MAFHKGRPLITTSGFPSLASGISKRRVVVHKSRPGTSCIAAPPLGLYSFAVITRLVILLELYRSSRFVCPQQPLYSLIANCALQVHRPGHCFVGPSNAGGDSRMRLILLLCKGAHIKLLPCSGAA